ncbi:MAG TPA: glycosyltransferase family 4 protein [Dehalococcoidia bacterium]|nr:glycosyltransferase family 4 protein [Dehalococcoidia bacterium]
MRIAQIAPLEEVIPPRKYGGTERVVSVLTEELVRRGHEVTLFASGDSQTSARLVACAPVAERMGADYMRSLGRTMAQCNTAYERAHEFDVIHNHLDHPAFRFARASPTPTVTTTHGRLDVPEIAHAYSEFPEQKLVSISLDQASYLPRANWVGNVYHGIDLSHFELRMEPGKYLAFVGRISPEKRPDVAIEIAERAGMPLYMAAKVDRYDQDYYDTLIEPMLRRSRYAELIGEVDDAEKNTLLGGAYACLFPIDWPEPFGLTMVESMATGTPVIARRRGSVPEVIRDGETGFICETVDEMLDALERVGSLDRHRCRQHVEENFSPEAMATHHEAVYESVVASELSLVG